MSNSLRKMSYTQLDSVYQKQHYNSQYQHLPPRKKRVKTKKKKSFLAKIFALLLLGLYGYFVCPYGYRHFVEPIIINPIANLKTKLNIEPYMYPLNQYINNSYIMETPLLVNVNKDSKELNKIAIVGELTQTKNKLLELFKNYPNLKPAVFLWDYSTGYSIEINADEAYESASIIKIPIAFELMRKIDNSSKTTSPMNLSDKRVYSEEYKTLGSGKLQYTMTDVSYSLDHLANIMISESDNSATNMILHEIGGMDGFNRKMRSLGLKETSMGQWLPDIEGYNKITAREVSTILYNLNNSNYINPKYKGKLIEYLGNTKNTHLLKEKLPTDAMVLHKTGNIGTMLGDSGIIYTGNGRKYILTILVKRPKNDTNAKSLIQDASLIIYNDMNSL